ncbi:hypothetical protein [Ralstonia phage RSK1]|uniref:Uncharacterized protein n=1 Tax=Ralstonia phage RSK1 TaxID=1417599 RepID=U6C806_9CAUD|nr:hypothetical protein X532_gp41 [Ralstonia phage RSK1]BAO04706.1 hypothetical protein [Ralstonia phage RSK1]
MDSENQSRDSLHDLQFIQRTNCRSLTIGDDDEDAPETDGPPRASAQVRCAGSDRAR